MLQGEGGARDSCDIVAIKFYLSKRTFDTERLLHGDMDVQCHMPATLSMHDNSSSSVKTASGYVLPPFVVMQRGQTLDEWARENRSPDFVAVFNVRSPEMMHALFQALARLGLWSQLDCFCSQQRAYRSACESWK